MMDERFWILLIFILIVILGPAGWRSFQNRREYISQVRQFRGQYQLPHHLSDRDVMGFCRVASRLNLDDQSRLQKTLDARDVEKPEAIWKRFHDAGFTDLWYANGGPTGGGSWHAGVWTGPQRDLICVKKCDTNEEAEKWLSPEGWTPDQAAQLALEKRRELAGAQQVCHRCGFVGEPWSEKLWHFCPKCNEELSKESCWGKARGEDAQT